MAADVIWALLVLVAVFVVMLLIFLDILSWLE